MAKVRFLTSIMLLCIMILLLASVYMFGKRSLDPISENPVYDFEEKKKSFIHDTETMNALMEKYNSPQTLTFDRLDIIEEYVGIYEINMEKRASFRTYIVDNEDALKEEGYDTAQLLFGIDEGEQAMLTNINGFKLDLETMGDSILLQYKPSEKERWQKIREELNDY